MLLWDEPSVTNGGHLRGRDQMKHETIVMAPDAIPVAFGRSLGVCLLLGASLWSGALYLMM